MKVLVAPREGVQLFEYTLSGLTAEVHGGAVQATEGAMVLGAPPAPARTLIGNSSRADFVGYGTFLQPLKVLVVVRQGRLVHIHAPSFGLDDCRYFPFFSYTQSRLERNRVPGDELPKQTWRDPLAFAANHDIDPGIELVQRFAHGAVAVGTAEDDAQARRLLLQALRQRQ